MGNDMENDIYKLDFAVEKSMRYHQRRRGWYDRLHKTFMLVIIVCGSAINLFAGAAEYLGMAAAVLAAVDLVFGLSHRARDHEMLFRRFCDLAAKIRVADAPDRKNYNLWRKERVDIEKDEPPIYAALEADCDNETRRAWGVENRLVNMDWWSRLTMHLLRQEKKFWPQTS